MAGSWSKRKASSLQHLQVWQHNKQVYEKKKSSKNGISMGEEMQIALQKFRESQKRNGG